MTPPAGQAPRSTRPRRELLGRTALCGALMTLTASLAGTAAAQVAPPPPAPPPPGLVPSGFTAASSGGGGPVILTDGNSADVTLHAPRTVIDWSSFNLAAGQHATFNFDARSWIVLNRIQDSTPATISGTVSGVVNGSIGGNIWFSARNGIILGPGAQIDAGGILATAASVDLGQFLDASNRTFDFSGETIIDGQILIQAGATLTGHGGLVALISPNITSEAGSAVNGRDGSNVLYGVAETYQIHLAQGAKGDLDLVDFIVPDAASGSRAGIGLDLQNTTTANSVFVAAVSRTSVASAVINLEGMITAQAAVADGGDIILSGGGGIVGKLPGATVAGAKPTDIYLRNLNASRDIVLANNGLTLATAWPRPPKVKPPPILPPPVRGDGNGNGNGNGF
ncbi:MAG TPA: filamentous hemagglutinin N-terminal domain-containing protein, partial [Phenylobacterium sp.]